MTNPLALPLVTLNYQLTEATNEEINLHTVSDAHDVRRLLADRLDSNLASAT